MKLLLPPHMGASTLLGWHKVAFLAPSHISTLSVLPTLEWATAIARRTDVAVVSGFSSRMELTVLKVLLRGDCGIILMMARMPYKSLPDIWKKPLDDHRLFIISTSKRPRQTRQSAIERNEKVCELADSVIMPCVPPAGSSLYTLYASQKFNGKVKTLL